MRWTNEQIKAIEGEGNLIVSAAAGAGKTAVLTERLYRLVALGVPVESLLVLTFTRAAAAEMKGRIEKRLLCAASEAENETEQKRLHEAASAVNKSSIQTIDAFSARIVKRYGHLIGLPPSARIADEAETAALAAESLEAYLADVAASQRDDLTALYRAFGSARAAVEAIKTLNRFLDAKPYPESWLDDAVKQYASDAYLDGILANAAAVAGGELSIRIAALSRAKRSLSPEFASVISQLDDELMRCRAVPLQKTYGNYREALFAIPFDTLRFPRGTDESEKTPVTGARDALKKCVKVQRAQFLRPEAGERAALAASGEVLSLLSEITLGFRAAFAERKRAANVLDYPDLGHMALKILDSEAVAKEYRERYRYIAVDEYQDTNRLNEAILLRVSRGDNLFFVGDVKQSVYRFRQAEPSLFLEKLESFSGARGTRIDLAENFRSAREVLAAVNETFAAVMTKEVGEMDYDARAALRYGANLLPGGAKIYVIDKRAAKTGDADGGAEEGEEADEAIADMENAALEGRLAARKIRELMETERVLTPGPAGTRELSYRDCAILMRSVKNALPFVQALAREGIPVSAEAAGGYFEAVEVQCLINYLSAIDNRFSDIPLLSSMLPPLGNFTAAELAKIRAAHREGFFYEAVLSAAEHGDEKAAAFLSELDAWQRESLLVSVETLIGEILERTHFSLTVGAMLGGRVRMANIEALVEKARIFESHGARDLSSFLSFLATVRDNGGLKSAQDPNEDAVRIMSMHKSKGLEFPVVVLCGLGKRFNLEDGKRNLVLHGDAGLGLKYIDAKTGLRMDTAARRMIAMRLLCEQLSEEMRILYVAMTRAKQQLVMIGSAENAEKLLSSGDGAPDPAKTAACRTHLAFLMRSARQNLPAEIVESTALLPGAANKAEPLPKEDARLTERLTAALSAVYPYAPAKPLPAKTSVSRVDGERMAAEAAFSVPAFMEEETSNALDAGTAAHSILQRLDFTPYTGEALERAVQEYVKNGYVDAEAVKRVKLSTLAAFTNSPLWARIAKACRVERELPFERPFDAGRFYEGADGQRVYLQGVIDCCFYEDGAWVLLDYKTDHLKRGVQLSEAAKKHERQLSLYAEALEKLMHAPVREKYVVLLNAGAAVLL